MHFREGWYLLYTRPKHEKKIATELEKQNIKLFLPTTKVLRQWHDRRKLVTIPLFPSYIFVYQTNIASFYEAIKINCVVGYVNFGKEVARVSESMVKNLQFVLENGHEIEISNDNFSPGQQLKIVYGLFEGFTCEMIRIRDKIKVIVRLTILNRSVTAVLPSKYLMAHDS